MSNDKLTPAEYFTLAARILQEQNKDALLLDAEVGRLQGFKSYVHGRLDQMGCPADPAPEATQEHGCRIEGRLNWVQEQAAKLESCQVAAQQWMAIQHYMQIFGYKADESHIEDQLSGLVRLAQLGKGLMAFCQQQGWRDGMRLQDWIANQVTAAHKAQVLDVDFTNEQNRRRAAEQRIEQLEKVVAEAADAVAARAFCLQRGYQGDIPLQTWLAVQIAQADKVEELEDRLIELQEGNVDTPEDVVQEAERQSHEDDGEALRRHLRDWRVRDAELAKQAARVAKQKITQPSPLAGLRRDFEAAVKPEPHYMQVQRTDAEATLKRLLDAFEGVVDAQGQPCRGYLYENFKGSWNIVMGFHEGRNIRMTVRLSGDQMWAGLLIVSETGAQQDCGTRTPTEQEKAAALYLFGQPGLRVAK